MKTAADPRHQRRQQIVQQLFAWDAQQKTGVDTPPSSGRKDEKTLQIINRLKHIDELISNAAPEWKLDKINQIDLAVLRLAVYELLFEENTPSKVIIDEAVELAKEFGNEGSPAFVNGALGKIFLSPERITRFIASRLGTDLDKLVPDAHLYTDLNASNLEISDLIVSLEKEYNFTVEPGYKFETVADLLNYIEDQVD